MEFHRIIYHIVASYVLTVNCYMKTGSSYRILRLSVLTMKLVNWLHLIDQFKLWDSKRSRGRTSFRNLKSPNIPVRSLLILVSV